VRLGQARHLLNHLVITSVNYSYPIQQMSSIQNNSYENGPKDRGITQSINLSIEHTPMSLRDTKDYIYTS